MHSPFTKKWYSSFFEVSLSQWYSWFPEWIFFSSLTVVRIKTQGQVFVKLDMLLSETLLDYHDVYTFIVFYSQQTICHWLNLQILHFIISKTIIVHFCKSWCIVKVLSTDCITHLVLSYSCCYFFPIFKNIVQITDSSSFNSGITITGYFFLYLYRLRH